MRSASRIALVAAAVLLIASGIWANLGASSFPEMRGAWLKHMIRGPGGVL
jgi:hypothetical protein